MDNSLEGLAKIYSSGVTPYEARIKSVTACIEHGEMERICAGHGPGVYHCRACCEAGKRCYTDLEPSKHTGGV